jgi:DNA polymerase-3 subunit delta'
MNNFFKYFKNFALYQSLAKQIANSSFSHSHLFICEDDFSGKVFSLVVANTLLCENLNACENCPSCLKVLSRTHADLYILPKEKKFVVADSHFIIENAYTKPINSDKKVFLINDFDEANPASQNKILKILEEPNKNVFFLINTTNEKKLLSTINSRVQKHFIPPFDKQTLKEILNENFVQFTQSALSLSDGYLGKALSLSEDKEFVKSYDFVINLLKNMKESKDIIKFTQSMAERSSFTLKLEILERIFRNILVFNSAKEGMLEDDEELTIRSFAREYSIFAVISILNRIIKAKTHFDANVSTGVIADNLLLGILEDKFMFKNMDTIIND